MTTEYEDDNAWLESLPESRPTQEEIDRATRGRNEDVGPVSVTRPGEAGVPLLPQVWPVPPSDPLARPARPAVRMSAGKRATR